MAKKTNVVAANKKLVALRDTNQTQSVEIKALKTQIEALQKAKNALQMEHFRLVKKNADLENVCEVYKQTMEYRAAQLAQIKAIFDTDTSLGKVTEAYDRMKHGQKEQRQAHDEKSMRQ